MHDCAGGFRPSRPYDPRNRHVMHAEKKKRADSKVASAWNRTYFWMAGTQTFQFHWIGSLPPSLFVMLLLS